MELLIYILFLPVAMLITGALMWRFPPKYKELGYNTERSQSSPEAWAYAQWLSSRLITLTHIPVLILSVVTVVLGFVLNFSDDAATDALIAAIIIQLTVLFTVFGIIEAKLHKRFDRNGKPK